MILEERKINLNTNNGATTLLFRHRLMTLFLICASVALFGCTTPPSNSNTAGNSNMSSNPGAMTNTNANTSAVNSAAFATKEPEAYSLTMTLTGQGSANNKQGTLQPQTIEFGRMGTDRRWSFNLPVIGQVIYLEKPSMPYLILPSRSQYVELSPNDIGFKLGNVMTPSAMIEQLKPRTQTENLGTETINGRTATKYRFTGSKDTGTQAGTVQSDAFVYIDEATGLPLRADINLAASSGGAANGVLETRDINLNPDPKLFTVPADYKKMTAEELKQQIQSFIQFIRVFAPMMTQQNATSTPQPATPQSTTPQATTPSTTTPQSTTPNANRQ